MVEVLGNDRCRADSGLIEINPLYKFKHQPLSRTKYMCVFYVKGYESLLRQVLQCGRPPGFTQTAAPRVVPRD